MADNSQNIRMPKMNECFVKIEWSENMYKRLYLPVYPDEVTHQIQATWSEQSIIGRSSPVSAYIGTSNRSVSFTFTLHREMEMPTSVQVYGFLGGMSSYTSSVVNNLIANVKDNAKKWFEKPSEYFIDSDDPENNVDKIISFINSGCYPQYMPGQTYHPITTFKFGDTYVCGKLKSVQTTWKKPLGGFLGKYNGNVIKSNSGNDSSKYMLCDVTVSIDNVYDRIVSAEDIFNLCPRGLGSVNNKITTK